jgi:hypothetical protein
VRDVLGGVEIVVVGGMEEVVEMEVNGAKEAP